MARARASRKKRQSSRGVGKRSEIALRPLAGLAKHHHTISAIKGEEELSKGSRPLSCRVLRWNSLERPMNKVIIPYQESNTFPPQALSPKILIKNTTRPPFLALGLAEARKERKRRGWVEQSKRHPNDWWGSRDGASPDWRQYLPS